MLYTIGDGHFFIIFFPFIYTIKALSIETSMEQSLVAFGNSNFKPF